LILENPFGIGALEFASRHHTEDVHNVYLSMFLNTGWLGGMTYLMIVGITLLFGLRHAFRRTASQPLYIVAYSALAAMVLLGSLIDTDHWRHHYLLLGMVWGLSAATINEVRRRRAPPGHAVA
jgi:O-antigen ligase